MKKIILSAIILLAGSINIAQLPPPSNGSSEDNDQMLFSEMILNFHNYIEQLDSLNISKDSLSSYKNYIRGLERYKYSNGYPNFTIEDYANDYNNWISLFNSNTCINHTAFPNLVFNEIGPENHVFSSSDYVSPYDTNRVSGTGQIHYWLRDHLNPQRMFACSGYGGLFLSTDNGQNWHNAGTDALPLSAASSVSLNLTDPTNKWYITSGNGEFLISGTHIPSVGIWKTTDAGQSYTCISNNGTTLDGMGIVNDNEELHSSTRLRKVISIPNGSSTRLVVAAKNGLFACDDPEVTQPVWKKIADGIFYDVEVLPNNQNIIYASGDHETPFVKYDFTSESLTILSDLNLANDINTLSYRRTSLEFPSNYANHCLVMIIEDDDARLYVYDIQNNSIFFKSKLEKTSDEVQTGVGVERAMGWTVSPIDNNGNVSVVYGNIRPIRLVEMEFNTDTIYNADWTEIMIKHIHDDQHFMKFNSTGTELFVGNDGGLYKTSMSDPINNWTNLNKGLAVSTADKMSTSQNGKRHLMASFQDMSNIYFWKDSTNDWSAKEVGNIGDGREDFVHPINSDKMFASIQGNGMRYTNDAWDSVFGGLILQVTNSRKYIEYKADDPNMLYGATYAGLKEAYFGNDFGRDSGVYFALNHPNPYISNIDVSITEDQGYKKPQNIHFVKVPENPAHSEYIYVIWRGGIDRREKVNGVLPPAINARVYRSKVGPTLDSTQWEMVYQYPSGAFGRVIIKYNDPNVFWVSVGGDLFKVDANTSTPIVTPYNEGLPNINYFGIRDMVYVNGSNDGIFLGTKHGLYYRDNDNYPDGFVRVCGFPNVSIEDLEIDYCRKKLIIATYGRGLWEADLNIEKNAPFIVTNNIVATENYYPGTDIIIESGATLTVPGTLYMPKDSKIIVKQGGKLLVDGGRITNACDGMWDGIEVWGNSNLSQTTSNQGYIRLTNGAIIEHARTAVSLWQPDNWNSTGGIIKASNSYFLNNRRDVEFMRYHRLNGNNEEIPNLSYFRNTQFIWNNDFRHIDPLNHVTLYKVSGVLFSGCDFADNRTGDSYFSPFIANGDIKACGIRSVDANYLIRANCNSVNCSGGLNNANWNPCTFTNLDFGVYASNSSTNYAVEIDRTLFTNNLYGIRTVAVSEPRITLNKIEYSNVNNNFTSTGKVGVNLIRTQGIVVQENSIENNSDASTIGVTTGFLCDDLGESEELLRKNNMVGLNNGILTSGKNRNVSNSGLEGLTFFCNTNSENRYDHLPLGNGNTDGIKAKIGGLDKPAGNTFTSLQAQYEDFFNLTGNTVEYFYKNSINNHEPFEYFNMSKFGHDLQLQCETELPTCYFCPLEVSESALQTEFTQITGLLDDLYEDYEALVNGGNTENLISTIGGMTSQNASSVRQALLGYSPYLTKEIVTLVANKPTSIYPHIWVEELVLANIDVAKSSDFISFLSSKNEPLPTQMISNIQSVLQANPTTAFFDLQTEISDLETEKTRIANYFSHHFQFDSTGVKLDSVGHWLNQKDNILKSFYLTDLYIRGEQYSEALNKLNELSVTSGNYPSHLQIEISNFIALKQIIITALESGVELADLTQTDQLSIEVIANDGKGLAKYQAQELLCFFFDKCATYQVTLPINAKSTVLKTDDSDEALPETMFTIYPNPAKNWVGIEFFKTYDQVSIVITDISGKVVLETTINQPLYIWDTRLVNNGVYIIKITNLKTNKVIGTDKIIIQN